MDHEEPSLPLTKEDSAWLSDWAWHEAMAKEREEEMQEVDRA
jgi:hypothetical protein